MQDGYWLGVALVSRHGGMVSFLIFLHCFS